MWVAEGMGLSSNLLYLVRTYSTLGRSATMLEMEKASPFRKGLADEIVVS